MSQLNSEQSKIHFHLAQNNAFVFIIFILSCYKFALLYILLNNTYIKYSI